MSSLISHVTVDCRDAYAQSVWWSTVLGYFGDPDDPNEPGNHECFITAPDGTHGILFLQVPDAKQVKNRLHFDLRPADGMRDEELVRLLGLGATTVADHRNPDGTGWVVLADPEGNEFCILRSQAEIDAALARSQAVSTRQTRQPPD